MSGAGCVWKIARRRKRAHPDFEPAEQVSREMPDGSLKVLHPTKGYRRVCEARLKAGPRMNALLDHYVAPRRKKGKRIYLRANPCPPSQDSRQQRRHRQRTGAANPYT